MSHIFNKLFPVILLVGLVSCQGKWTDEDKESFVSKCSKEGGAPKDYCECVYEKLNAEYKNPNQAIKALKKEDFAKLQSECSIK